MSADQTEVLYGDTARHLAEGVIAVSLGRVQELIPLVSDFGELWRRLAADFPRGMRPETAEDLFSYAVLRIAQLQGMELP